MAVAEAEPGGGRAALGNGKRGKASEREEHEAAGEAGAVTEKTPGFQGVECNKKWASN